MVRTMKVVVTLIILLGSALSVYAQSFLAHWAQWVLPYGWLFACAYVGGLRPGVLATVTTISLAGIFLVPAEKFGFDDVIMLLMLTGIGFWVSYLMERSKADRFKVLENDSLDKLLDNIPLMVFVKDAGELRFRNFNEFGLKLLGLKREDIMGKTDFDFFPHEQADFFRKMDHEALATGMVRDIPVEEIDTPNGKRLLHTKKIPISDEKGKALYLLCVSEDVTEKIAHEKKHALELQEQAARKERLRIRERETAVAQAISSLSATLDYEETINGVVKAVVPAIGDWAVLSLINEEGRFVRTAGHHSEAELLPALHEFMRDFPPTAEDVEAQQALLEGISTLEKFISDEELMALGRNERKKNLYRLLGTNSSVIVPVQGREGILGVLGISRRIGRGSFDELDFSLAQELGRKAGTLLDNTRLFQSTQRAVKARDEFLSIASHELKTPITSLRLQLEMLMRPGKTQDITRPVQNAVKQVDRLTLLVNDLLDVGRLESGKLNYLLDLMNIGDIVKEVTDALLPQFLASGTPLHIEIEGNPQAWVDRYRMEQVLVNLLNNAMKYGLRRPVHVTLKREGNEVILKVKDKGEGIPENQLGKIFGKFERGGKVSSIAGLGLGLYITREIITAFRGSIEVESAEGEWTEFTVLLPGA